MAFNTSVLSGYAKEYAQARNAGANNYQAHNYANIQSGGSGITMADVSRIISGSSVSQPQYQTNPTTGQILTGYEQPLKQEEEKKEELDINSYINQLKESQRTSRIAALDKAKSSALSSLDTEKANVAPTYYDKRNQAAAASDVGAMNFAQYMAARGIKGAAGAMPEIYRQAGLQGQIGALDRQEAGEMSAIERQRSNVESGYASDVAAAEADVEAQAMQSLINQWNADRQYNLQYGQAVGNIGGTPTLAAQEFDWSRSSSNPSVQSQILANKAQELENAAREIQNSYLPDTLKMEAEQLKQKVQVGTLDYDTALAQLDQIRAQTAAYQRQANSTGGSSGGLTAYQQWQMENQMTADAEKAQQELNADKAALGSQLTQGKLTREQAISEVLNQYHSDIISYDYANELLKTIDVYKPGVNAAPAALTSGDWNYTPGTGWFGLSK